MDAFVFGHFLCMFHFRPCIIMVQNFVKCVLNGCSHLTSGYLITQGGKKRGICLSIVSKSIL